MTILDNIFNLIEEAYQSSPNRVALRRDSYNNARDQINTANQMVADKTEAYKDKPENIKSSLMRAIHSSTSGIKRQAINNHKALGQSFRDDRKYQAQNEKNFHRSLDIMHNNFKPFLPLGK